MILNKTYDFSRYQTLAEHVKKLKKVDILRFYDKYVAANAPLRQKLCVHVVAKQHDNDEDKNTKKGDNDDDNDNEKKMAAAIVSSSSEGVEEEDQDATKEGTAMDVVDDDDDNNKNNQEKQDSAKTTNEALSSFLSTANVIRIEDPVEFRRTMPLYPMPPNAPVTVVEVGIKK